MASKAPAKAETKSLLEKVLAKAKATKTKATLCIDLGQICLTDSCARHSHIDMFCQSILFINYLTRLATGLESGKPATIYVQDKQHKQ